MAVEWQLSGILARLEAQQECWSDDVLASAGAIVSVGWDGDVAVERGLMRGDDAVEPEVAEHAVADVVRSAGLPATLITDLTARRTAALQVTAAGNVPVMVAAVVHALALRAFYRFAHETCLKLSVEVASPERNMGVPEACAAVQRIADSHRAWSERLPEDPAMLWNWCLAQAQDVLAHIGALSIDAIRQGRSCRRRTPCSRGRFGGGDWVRYGRPLRSRRSDLLRPGQQRADRISALRGERHTRRTSMEPDEESRAGCACCPRGCRDGLASGSAARS